MTLKYLIEGKNKMGILNMITLTSIFILNKQISDELEIYDE